MAEIKVGKNETLDSALRRFKLYPTQNIYTFLLLDTINGRTWQVQWSLDNKAVRGIVGEIK